MAPAALLDLAVGDPSLHVATLGKSAHLTLDAGSAGELILHLRVRDGVTDVRVDGSAAGAVDVRAQDVRTALAGEGLVLGKFESLAAPEGRVTTAGQADGVVVNAAFNGSPGASAGLSDRGGAETPRGSDATQTSAQSHAQSGFGSQSRDRRGPWDPDGSAADVEPVVPSRPGSQATASNEPHRRRGLHVKA